LKAAPNFREDLEVVAGLGLATVIDFRSAGEVETDGPDRLPDGLRPLALPIFDAEHDIYALMADAVASRDAARQVAFLGDGRAERRMCDLYRWLVTGAGPTTQFAAALRRLAEPGAAPVLYHCTAGKDRTGWMSAVLLTLLGVPGDQVEADYLETNARSRPGLAKLTAALVRRGYVAGEDLLLPLLEARPDYLAAAWAEVDGVYGGFDRYLTAGLGLDDATIAALREAFLTR
jgi:protein-tyrosine phosphatase